MGSRSNADQRTASSVNRSPWTSNQDERRDDKCLKQFFLPILQKNSGHQNTKGLTVFVPLCDKTPDLMYFYNLGCTVVGLLFEKQLIEEFFKENKFEEIPCSMESIRMSADKRMYLVQSDLFSFTKDMLPVGEFDVIWDCRAFETINSEDRRKYAIIITSLLKEYSGIYLIRGLQCKRGEKHSHVPPYPVFTKDLELEFTKLHVNLLHTQNVMTEEPLSEPHSVGSLTRTSLEISEMSESLWLLRYRELEDRTDWPLDIWVDRYNRSDIPWVEPRGSQPLKELFPVVWKRVNGDAVMTERSVFLPLCGKSQDLLYFYNLGFRVVGVEFVQKAIDEFFSENQLQFEQVAPNITQTTDRRLSIVQGDIYSVELPVQQFDVIWDRGSFGSINIGDREKYLRVVRSVSKKPHGMHILSVFEYDMREHTGPPHSLYQQDIERFYPSMSVEKIYSRDMITEETLKDTQSFGYQFKYMFGVNELAITIYLLIHRSKPDTQL